MLNKINLIIKPPTKNILVIRKLQNSQWQFPSLYFNDNDPNLIQAILNTVTDCSSNSIKSIKYLFNSHMSENITSIDIPMFYYEVVTDGYKTLNPKGIYSLLVYHSIVGLNSLSDKALSIDTYLRIVCGTTENNNKYGTLRCL